MPTKIFTLTNDKCPFGCGHAIDSQGCRSCQWYFRAGTGTFFWCKHPEGVVENAPSLPKAKRRHPETLRKPGRPKKLRETPSNEDEGEKQ